MDSVSRKLTSLHVIESYLVTLVSYSTHSLEDNIEARVMLSYSKVHVYDF